MLRYLIVFFLFISSFAYSQGNFEICGTITDIKGNTIPFASIYLKGTNISSMANDAGRYSLRIDTGHHTLLFRYVGYKEAERELYITSPDTINIILKPDVYELKAVMIGKHDDPSYAMIKKVMANRKYLRQIPSYSCEVYTKGVQKLVDAPKRLLGQDVKQTLNLDSNRRGIIYQSETKSKFYFNYPHVKEEMLASKVAGDKEGFSFNRALDLQVNLYQNLIQWKAWGNQSFVSPVADFAFNYYNFKLLGTSNIEGREIHKIEISPKHKYDPAFKGYLYLVGGSWRIYSVDLLLTRDARINFVDTLRISQQFRLVDNEYWLPSDITFKFSGRVLGFSFSGYFTGLYSNYVTNPAFGHDVFTDEILHIPNDVNKKDSEWWEENRPVPLSEEEDWNYAVKDSLEELQRSKAYVDSIQRVRNRFNPIKYTFAGYTINNFSKRSSWYFYPLNRTLFYNTTEGWGADLKMRYMRQFSFKRSLEFEPNARYSSNNKLLNLNAEITYRTDTLMHESFTIKGGSDFLDLNNRGTVNLFYNSLTSLFEGKNYLRQYKANFLSFSAQREITDGLMVTGGIEMARRFPIRNSANDSSFADFNRLYPGDNLFPASNAFSFETKLSYTYGQHYTRRPDGKIYEPARYPTLKLTYRKGIKGVINSAVDYDFASADLYQDKLKTGLMGYSSFYLSAGKFFSSKSLYFPDLRHFTGNQTAVYNPLFPNFHFLDYYSYATNNSYLEAHYEHNFAGAVLKKVPLLRRLNLEEIVGGAYLTQPLKDYKEVYIGIQRLIFRFDYGWSWVPGRPVQQAFRLFYGF
ncbi:DUF5686 and carboxypeptidase regulatory-like domain-containing protein [Desertivirga brevis]|uniref:DUF5686 and carboxypeptidase regulatory-like domain-containing protein n=1 Tax=Desertivirga brevis TaxID=2810310 RepID=UPI001A97CF9C|nr:DUF5686 and carboxypeptidase regulatory-like domain-containing protein [Pedobacter sp. SYSU D00873]